MTGIFTAPSITATQIAGRTFKEIAKVCALVKQGNGNVHQYPPGAYVSPEALLDNMRPLADTLAENIDKLTPYGYVGVSRPSLISKEQASFSDRLRDEILGRAVSIDSSLMRKAVKQINAFQHHNLLSAAFAEPADQEKLISIHVDLLRAVVNEPKVQMRLRSIDPQYHADLLRRIFYEPEVRLRFLAINFDTLSAAFGEVNEKNRGASIRSDVYGGVKREVLAGLGDENRFDSIDQLRGVILDNLEHARAEGKAPRFTLCCQAIYDRWLNAFEDKSAIIDAARAPVDESISPK